MATEHGRYEKETRMKLYECPRNVIVHVIDSEPPLEVKFHRVDGMYSYCTLENGDVVHLAAWTEVEIIEESDDE